VIKTQEKPKCYWCNAEIISFRDKLSYKEFQISKLCQRCQDFTFKNLEPLQDYREYIEEDEANK